jgi:metallo-beta-lactamase family protein
MYELLDDELGAHFLIDCGKAQGSDAALIENGFPFDPSEIQFVLLTHAHLDHCGRLPELVRSGFKGPVICTAPTARLAKSLLLNAADHQPGRPREYVERIRWKTEEVHVTRGWLTAREANLHGKQIFYAPFRSSHLLGSVGFALSWGPERSRNPVIVFGGDIGPKFEGNECDFLEGKGQLPPFFPDSPCYTLVLESTYGAREELPRSRSARLAELTSLLEQAAAESRIILIPAFALGRLQQVLFDLQSIRMQNCALQCVKVFSPKAGLGVDASMAYLDCLFEKAAAKNGELKPLYANKDVFAQAGADISTSSGEAQAKRILAAAFGFATTEPVHAQPIEACDIENLRSHAPCVLVAPSGMADYGLMRQAIACHATDARTTVAFCGYQARGSPGSVLMQRANNGTLIQDVRIWNDGSDSLSLSNVQAEAVRIEGYSGHATAPQLLSIVFDDSVIARRGKLPNRVFLVHGDHANRFALQSMLEKRADQLGVATEIRLPRTSTTEWIDLDAPIPVPTVEEAALVLQSLAASKPSAFRRIMADIRKLIPSQSP